MSEQISTQYGRSHAYLTIAACWTLTAATLFAGDWPQILGPSRNGRATDERIVDRWPATGPKVNWSREVGQGYAGPSVKANHVVIFHRVGDSERIEAVHATSGKRIWKTDFAADYRGGINPDSGPRCVPLVDNGRVFVFGAAGVAHCVDLRDGRHRWSRQLLRDYNSQEGYFGAGSTPIVVDERLLVNVGGRNGAGIVALDVNSGKTLWSATNESASYSSPTMMTSTNGQRRVVFITRLNAVSLDPVDGSVNFRTSFGMRGPTVNAATPIVFDNHLFLTASYGIGAVLLKVNDDRATQVWANDTSLSSQYNTPVYNDGFIYGIHGREDIGVADLRCIDARTGRITWSEQGFGVANLILADGKLVLLKTTGQLVLAEASPASYRQLAVSNVSEKTSRALPALANGRLFFRNGGQGGGNLICLDLTKP